MRRAFVGGRSLLPRVGRLAHLGFGPGQPVGKLRDLPGQLQHGAVLLLHVPLEKGKAFFEVAQAGIHEADDARRSTRGKPMPEVYDNYDNRAPAPCFGGGQPGGL